MKCTCENCGNEFDTGTPDWYDLCDECGPVYEDALHEAQQSNPDTLRVVMNNVGSSGFKP